MMNELNIVIVAFTFVGMFTGFLVGYCIRYEDGEKKGERDKRS